MGTGAGARPRLSSRRRAVRPPPANGCSSQLKALAEKVRNQVGVLPAPRLHHRAAAPSTTSTPSSTGKGWFSFQKPSGSAAPSCRSGCAAVPGLADARLGCGCLLVMLLPCRDAQPRQTWARCCFSSSQMETSTRRGRPPAPSGSRVPAETGGEGVGAAVALGALLLGSPAAKRGDREPQ